MDSIHEHEQSIEGLGNKDIRGRGIPSLLIGVRFFSQIVLADIFSLRNLLHDLFSFG